MFLVAKNGAIFDKNWYSDLHVFETFMDLKPSLIWSLDLLGAFTYLEPSRIWSTFSGPISFRNLHVWWLWTARFRVKVDIRTFPFSEPTRLFGTFMFEYTWTPSLIWSTNVFGACKFSESSRFWNLHACGTFSFSEPSRFRNLHVFEAFTYLEHSRILEPARFRDLHVFGTFKFDG